MRNLVVEEVEKYLDKYKENVMSEFPRSHPYIETPSFLSKVSTKLLQDAGLLEFLPIEKELIQEFQAGKVYNHTSKYWAPFGIERIEMLGVERFHGCLIEPYGKDKSVFGLWASVSSYGLVDSRTRKGNTKNEVRGFRRG